MEIKVDAETGALYEVVLLEEPPLVEAHPRPDVGAPHEGSVRVDRSIWEWIENPDYARAKKSVVEGTTPMWCARSGSTVVLGLDSLRPSNHYYSCGDVQVGVNSLGELAEIIAFAVEQRTSEQVGCPE
nr:hypothetical protein [Micromonospora sp. DSM 115978]